TIPGATTFAGQQRLQAFLSRSQVLINVLPLTDETRGILDAALFSKLPKGSALIQMGRGGHLNVGDLIAAVDDGTLGWAMLDVFPKEPLDENDPLWSHPRVLVTPHIAAEPVGSAAQNHVVAKIRDFRRGVEPLGRVDPSTGY